LIALELGIPVAELQERMSSSEFLEWTIYLEEKANEFNPLFWYLAQIAREVRLGWSKKRNHKLKDFLLSFTTRGEKSSRVTEGKDSEEERQSYLESSKRFWCGLLGIKLKDD
jgi:hypothetical protein